MARNRCGLRACLVLALLAARPAASDEPAGQHVLEPGQTLWSVAYSNGVRVEDLLLANGIDDPTAVRAGQAIVVPDAPVAVEPPPEPGAHATPPPLAWPLRGVLTSRYGRRGRGLHSGLDIAAPPGTIIAAAAAGRVTRAGKGWGRYGRVVLIDHGDGLATLYAHASRVFVKPGDVVQRGTAIAAVGRSGNATGPHLHFEVWGGDRTLDPLGYLEASDAESLGDQARR